MSTEDKSLYAIGRVAALANLTTHTVRAWEKRYGAVEPVRSEGGTRRYTDQHVQRLQRLKAAVEAGHRIGDIASLSLEDLGELVRQPKGGGRRQSTSQTTAKQAALDPLASARIVRAARKMDATAVENALNVQYRVLGAIAFRRDFCTALLWKIGHLWQSGEIDVASEHLVSNVIQSILIRDCEQYRAKADYPLVLLTTPEEETHVLGLLIGACELAQAGARLINLGPRLSPPEIIKAVRQAEADVVALSVLDVPIGNQRSFLRRLKEGLDPSTQIWLGGNGAVRDEPGCEVLELHEVAIRVQEMGEHRQTGGT